MLKFRYIAPAGTAITLTDLFNWVSDLLTRKDRTNEFLQAFKSKYGIRHCFAMSSARAALALIFTVLKDKQIEQDKNEIVLPSYTCYSVPAAAEIAGLKVRICDVDPVTLDYDLEQLNSLDFSSVLAIVSANLFGNPNNLTDIEQIARKNKVLFIDDAAQAMNAVCHGRFAGTFGDIGIFSLDKGKNITSIQGGIVTTNDDDLADLIGDAINQLPEPEAQQNIADSVKLIIYIVLLRPWLYWIPANLPALGLGKTIYTTDYLFTKYSRHLASLTTRLFNRIDKITRQRQDNAEHISKILHKTPGLKLIRSLSDTTSASLRVAMTIDDLEKKKQLLQKLNEQGIGASTSYPESIADLKQVKKFSSIQNIKIENGAYVARHILTLPTISYMTEKDIQLIGNIFKECMTQ